MHESGASNTEKLAGGTYFQRCFQDHWHMELGYFWKWFCAELGNLPFGPTRTHNRGECCGPFTSKTHAKHPWEWFLKVLGHLGLFQKIVILDHMLTQKPQSLKTKFQHFGSVDAWIRSFKYWGTCSRYSFSTFLSISLRFGSAVFLKNAFALNVETCPSGPPDDTAEKSAAHHFSAKHT